MTNGHPDTQEPRANQRFPVRESGQLSPPRVGSPIYGCARAVHVDGFIPHALVNVYANDIELIGHDRPYVGFADIGLTRELNPGDRITATQSAFGLTSSPSYVAVIVQHPPASLDTPVVGPDFFDCGRVVWVSNLTASTRVEVFAAATNPPSTDAAHLVGQADVTGTSHPVVTSPLRRGDFVAAVQISCPAGPAPLRSGLSAAVAVQAEPAPVQQPVLQPPVVGNDVANMNHLYIGAAVEVRDRTVAATVGGGLATGEANWTPISPPIQGGHDYRATQSLCTPSLPSDPVSTTDILQAPVLVSPICVESRSVTIRGTLVNATVVLLRGGRVIGIGGAQPGELELSIGPAFTLAANDALTVVQFMGTTVSGVSNTVHVGDCRNVITQHNDNSRSGAYLHETTLTPANVGSTRFGRLYERHVNGDILAQILYVRGIRTALGMKNLVLAATSTNEVYAFDAGNTSSSPTAGLVWKTPPLRPTRLLTDSEICRETVGSVGITSTPVIDVTNQVMYVVTRAATQPGDPRDGTNFLHALNLTDGSERHPAMEIQAVDRASGRRFDARCQRNRPGLLLLNGVVYVAFATFSCDGDCPDGNHYRGWVLGYRAADLQQVAVFCTAPDGGGAGIWQSGNGLVGMDDGTIYFETGNDTEPAALGDSFVKLRVIDRAPGLELAGSFGPSNRATLRSGDTDLGSGGPMLLPTSGRGPRLIGGGKQGRLYVLNTDSMALTQATTVVDAIVGEGFQAFINTWHQGPSGPAPQYMPTFSIADYARDEHPGPNIHGGPIYWRGTGYLYHMPEKDYLKAFRYDLTTGLVGETPIRIALVRPPDGMPGGHSSLSANGDRDGIVWTCYPNADGQWNPVTGTLAAFDATDLQELWRDREPVNFAKFNPPTIADGRVYRPAFASYSVPAHGIPTRTGPGRVIVYGLLFPRPRRPWPRQFRWWRDGGDPAPHWSIDEKWAHLGGQAGLLHEPLGKEESLRDARRGRRRDFQGFLLSANGPRVSVHVPMDAGVRTCDDPVAKIHVIVESSIYWTRATGAHVVMGEIRAEWLQVGGHGGRLGYPIADEADTPDGDGRISRFEHGEIVWYPGKPAAVRQYPRADAGDTYTRREPRDDRTEN